MDMVIECRDLYYAYGGKSALHGVGFSVGRGSVFGLLGKNGAGKSTVINMLMGFLQPSKGSCRVFGEKSHALSATARSRIGLLLEGFVQYDFMSPGELERYYGSLYPQWERDVFFDLIKRMHMPFSRPLSRMSNGQRSQVVLGLIMAQRPELMILDDYSMGLDVGYRRLFIDFLREYVLLYGTTVLLTSHVVQELDCVIDEMVVLKDGRVCVCMSKKEFMNSFRGFCFERTAESLAIQPDSFVRGVDHTSRTSSVYGFFDEWELKRYLVEHGISFNGFTPVEMSFEDAFVGLTGKY